MRRFFVSVTAMLFLSFSLSLPSFGETATAAPYESGEFPSWAYDIRRTEIITLGSLPFVTIGVSLVYGAVLYANGTLNSFPNPLDKSSDSFSTGQHFKIFAMSAGVSCALGATDLVVSFIQHRNKKKRLMRIEENSKKIRIDPYIFTPAYEEEQNVIEEPSLNDEDVLQDDEALQNPEQE